MATTLMLPLLVSFIPFLVFRFSEFEAPIVYDRIFSFDNGQFFDFLGSTFGQAFLGASYGAVGAFYAVTESSRRSERASLSREILQLVHEPTFVEVRRNAATYLKEQRYVDAAERPIVGLQKGFSDLLRDKTKIEGSEISGSNEVRKVMSQIELIGDLCESGAVDARILKQSISSFIEYWIRLFLVLEKNEEEPENWKQSVESLRRARIHLCDFQSLL